MSTAQTASPLAAGTRLDAYEIAGVLEQGRFSITYLARDGAGGEVAIKEFLPHEFAVREDGAVRAREVEDRTPLRFWLRSFLDKAVLLQKLNHPGLVRVLRQFEANGTGYYVTERVAGETLAVIVEREGVLGEAQLRRLLTPVLAGLEQAHAVGLLHRDIRPENLLVRPDDSAVLSGFGVLRAPIRFKARTVFSAGTPPYAAPEEFYMAGPHGPWTDLYALGATAYRVITGEAPPDARSRASGPALAPVAMKARVRCSEALGAAIDEALHLPAEQRPQSVAAWRNALQGAGTEEPEPVVEGFPPMAPGAVPRSRSRLPLLIGVVVVAAAAGGYFLLGSRGAPEEPAAVAPAVQARTVAAPAPAAAVPAATDAATAAAAPAPAQGDAELDRLALDLMAKEKKVADARDQLQTQREQAAQEARTSVAAGGRTTAAAATPPAPSQAELEAAEHLRQLQAEVDRLRKEKEAQPTAPAMVASAAAPTRSGPDWPTWYREATSNVRQSLRYPQESLQAGEEGDILVKVRLRRDGSLIRAEMQQRSPYAQLNREALEVFSRIGRFPPLPGDYQPNNPEVDLSMPINFKMND
ncbi:MAG: TonB family protein [Nevskia sp.]|nr:TonB family protein [Nevskia sp.]